MPVLDQTLGDRYRLVRLIGRGGMADVYHAVDRTDGTDVAVKVVRSGDPEFVRRMTQEARALENLRHPGLVTLLDSGRDGDDAYLVLDLVNGPTLEQRLRGGPLDTATTAALGSRLADALAYIHGRGIVHRDVKPSNILQTPSGEPWLGDFGIAQLVDATTVTAAGSALGTLVYMAPEQLSGRRVGPAADVWALGMVLLECLTGRRAYTGTPGEIVAHRLTNAFVVPTSLPTAWKMILAGMLAEQPEDRLTASQVAALLVTSPFSTPWILPSHDATEALPLATVDAATRLLGGATPGADAGGVTKVLNSAPPVIAQRRRRGWSALAALLALLVAVWIWWAVPWSSRSHDRQSATTTTLSLTSRQLQRFEHDLAAASANGSIDGTTSAAVRGWAQHAVTDALSGANFQAATELQRAVTALSDGAMNGSVSTATAGKLERDLAYLAVVLGVTAPSATTTSMPSATTTTTIPVATPPTTVVTAPPGGSPGDGHGNGHGHGHDHGNGD